MNTAIAVWRGEVVVLRGDRLDGAPIPGWRFRRTVDVGLAADGDRLVVLAVVARARGHAAFVRTGPDWGPWTEIAGWKGAVGDIAVVDGELVVVGAGRYRIGDGDWRGIPDWQDGAVAADVADLDGDGRPELLVRSGGQITVGWGLGDDGWGPWTAHAGAGAAFAPAADGQRPKLISLHGERHRAAALKLDIDKASDTGVWRILDFDSQILAVHAALLHTGDVLIFAGSGYRKGVQNYRTRVWRYPTRTFTTPRTPIDLFCCGHAFLPGGRLLVAGGTRQYDPFRGIRDALAFDFEKRRWERIRKMARERWYPSLITLADGRILSVSGRGADGDLQRVSEIFTLGKGWKRTPEHFLMPFYPQLTLLADGRLFYSGGYMGARHGAEPAIWNWKTGASKPVPGLPDLEMRSQAASVLLPPADEQRVMIVGGGGADMHHHHDMREPLVATKGVAICDLTAAAPKYKAAAPVRHARMHLNLVLLPDRTVMATGGASVQEKKVHAALEAELFDPKTGKWRRGAKSRVPRLYHSVALLMPDGKVITAGSNPKRGVEEYRIEVYSPPYLFKGPRPQLTLSRDHAKYGASLRATTPDPAALREVNLVRPSATTHASNLEQRLLDLPFEVKGANRIDLTLPAEPNLAPPGWYMVFAVDAAGVPSQARWLHLA
jgi:Galactose oxidase-like, Early set domain